MQVFCQCAQVSLPVADKLWLPKPVSYCHILDATKQAE
jgi:hypothetical protein